MQFKIVLAGNSGVGKSSIFLRYLKNEHEPSWPSTIGFDIGIKHVHNMNKESKLIIWDTAGQERYQSITRGYFTNAQGVIFVFDLTNRQSFDNIGKWYDLCPQDCAKILVGNKKDLDTIRTISYYEGKALAEAYDMSYIETSASQNQEIDNIFEIIAAMCIGRYTDTEPIKETISVNSSF